QPMDPVTLDVALAAGYDAAEHRAQRFRTRHFASLDKLIVLEESVRRRMPLWAPRSFAGEIIMSPVPNPWRRPRPEHEIVLERIEAIVAELVAQLVGA